MVRFHCSYSSGTLLLWALGIPPCGWLLAHFRHLCTTEHFRGICPKFWQLKYCTCSTGLIFADVIFWRRIYFTSNTSFSSWVGSTVAMNSPDCDFNGRVGFSLCIALSFPVTKLAIVRSCNWSYSVFNSLLTPSGSVSPWRPRIIRHFALSDRRVIVVALGRYQERII